MDSLLKQLRSSNLLKGAPAGDQIYNLRVANQGPYPLYYTAALMFTSLAEQVTVYELFSSLTF